jgi:uncharacterized membrane protein YkvA (DUF1232 family)
LPVQRLYPERWLDTLTKPMNGIHEFVIRGGQTVSAGQMDAFRRKLPFLKVKAEMIDTPDFPHLKPQTDFLVRYAEDVLDGVYPCSDLQAIAETIFALSYLLKEVDIIPDSVPHLGLADDSVVLRAVLKGHETEFRTFAMKSELDFDSVTTES